MQAGLWKASPTAGGPPDKIHYRELLTPEGRFGRLDLRLLRAGTPRAISSPTFGLGMFTAVLVLVRALEIRQNFASNLRRAMDAERC